MDNLEKYWPTTDDEEMNRDDKKFIVNVEFQKRITSLLNAVPISKSYYFFFVFIKIVSTDKLLNMVPLTILIIIFIITEKLMGVIMEVRFGSKL